MVDCQIHQINEATLSYTYIHQRAAAAKAKAVILIHSDPKLEFLTQNVQHHDLDQVCTCVGIYICVYEHVCIVCVCVHMC